MYLVERYMTNKSSWEAVYFVKKVDGIKRKIKRIFCDKDHAKQYMNASHKHHPDRLFRIVPIEID